MKLFIIIPVLIFVSCSQGKKKKQGELEKEESVYSGVQIDKDTSKDNEEKIKIFSENEGYGPISPNETNTIPKRNPVIAVQFAPSFYKSACYIGILSRLERVGIKINMVLGTGFSAVIAALYSEKGNANDAEWNFFRILKQFDRDDEPFSSSWEKKYKKSIKEVFAKEKIQNLNRVLLLPVRNKKTKAIEIRTKGNLVDALVEGLFESNPGDWGPAQTHQVFYDEELRKRGADLVFNFSSLPNKIKLRHSLGYPIGYFSLILSALNKNDSELMSFNDGKWILDDISDVQEYKVYCRQKADEHVKTILEKIKGWKEGSYAQ